MAREYTADSDGQGELSLDYFDPDGSHQQILGKTFDVDHNPILHQDALTSLLSTTSSQQMNPTTSFPQKIEATPSQEVPSTTSSQQVTLTISTQQATSSTSTLQVTPTTSSYHATSAVFSRQVIPTRSSQQAGSISALTTTSSSDTTSLIAGDGGDA